MASKGSNEGYGCLAIIGLVVGFLLVKNFIWPWFTANKEAIGTWTGIVLVAVLVIWCVGWAGAVFMKSRKACENFENNCGGWLNGAMKDLDNAEKFVSDDAREAKQLEDRVTKLENAVRGIR